MSLFIEYAILFLTYLIQIFYWVLMAHIISSWIFFRPNQFTLFLKQIVDPVLFPFRWARIGMIDFSPIVALLAIEFFGTLLLAYLRTFLVT